PTGRLLAHADNDTDVSTELLHPLPFSLGVVFLALFSAISLVIIDPWLALVALLIFPALTALNQVYSRRIEEPSARVQAGVGRVSSIAHESFDGALVVKTLGRADAEGRRFAEAATVLRRRRVAVGYIRAVFESILDALPNLGIVAVVVFGTYRIDAGAITRGDLVQVASLFTVLALPMRVLGFFLEMMPPSVVARRRLNGVLSLAEPDPPAEPRRLPDGPLSVEVRDLRFAYDDGTPVLDGVDLTIAPGEVVALVGSTGAGKSTLCHLVAGLIPPSSGRIEVGGETLDRLTERERTDAVSLVFQESFLFADTVRANIDLAGDRQRAELDRAAEVAQVTDVVAELPNGYDTVVGERGVTLSGGQRQRVALARAVIRTPRLLILDDATSAVDPKVEQQILSGLRGGAPTTSLIVAQRVSTIRLADRVLYLSGGRIAAQGRHEDLMANHGYSALVRAYEMVNQ
ncbi:MAG: ABC transporter ATP-binding protein, partial [Actinomycetota bacterium]